MGTEEEKCGYRRRKKNNCCLLDRIEGGLCDGLMHTFRSWYVSVGKTLIWEEVCMIFNNFHLFLPLFFLTVFLCALSI